MQFTERFDVQRLLKGMLLVGAIAVAWKLENLGNAHGVPEHVDRARQQGAQESTRFAQPEDARSRSSLLRKPLGWWKAVLVDTYEALTADRLLAVAAGVVFYALLAIFPAITAFVSFYGLFADPSTVQGHLSLLSDVLPSGGLDIVQEQIGRIAVKPSELSLGFAFGLVLALWSSNAGVKAMIDALNVIEEQDERRSFVGLNALSLTFTLGAIVFLLLAVGAVVAFPLVMSTLGLNQVVGSATWLVRWPALFAIVLFAIIMLYRFGPSGEMRRWRWITPGAIVAAVTWLAGSAALSFYLSNFADYNATYGSLGAGIGLMVWMWLSTIVALLGAEIDTVIYQRLHRDPSTGQPGPAVGAI